MRSVVLFIYRPRLLLYFAGSGVNKVQVVSSVFSVRLFCPGKTFMYVWLYVFPGTRACLCRCDGFVVVHDLNWWYVCHVYVE